jgi:NTE family protein
MQIGRLAFVLIATFLLQACSHAPLAYRVPVPAIMPAAAPLPNINVALALSGGGARGAAHIGVISALDHHGIPIDLVVGSSIGAVVGALYAEHGDISKVHRKVHKITKWDLFDPSIKNMIGFITAKAGAGGGQRFIHRLESLLTVDYFEQLRIPFIAVSSDLKHNKAAAIRSGPLVPAIYASAATGVAMWKLKRPYLPLKRKCKRWGYQPKGYMRANITRILCRCRWYWSQIVPKPSCLEA